MSFLNRGQIIKDWVDLNYDSTTSINANNLAYDSTSTIKTKLETLIASTLSNNFIDTFTLNSTDVNTNKYVTLSMPLSGDDIELSVAGAPTQTYGTDYTMLSTTRLSWSGLGLDSILETGDVITVVYKTPV